MRVGAAVEISHVGDGKIAERVDDGVARAAALARSAEKFQRHAREQGIAGADGEEKEHGAGEVDGRARRTEGEHGHRGGIDKAREQESDGRAHADGNERSRERARSGEQCAAQAVDPGHLLAGDAVIAGEAREQADHGAAAEWSSNEQRVGNGFPAQEGGFEFVPDARGGLARRCAR